MFDSKTIDKRHRKKKNKVRIPENEELNLAGRIFLIIHQISKHEENIMSIPAACGYHASHMTALLSNIIVAGRVIRVIRSSII